MDGATVRALGLEFPGPVGLAAGFDRDASRIDEILEWGFGFVELGTVTPHPVPGHNPGAAALAANLARSRVRDRAVGLRPVIGINLGLQPGALPEDAWRHYVCGMRVAWSSADYLVLNFTSSPATSLHLDCHRGVLQQLLVQIQDERRRLAAAAGRRLPLLVKWPVGKRYEPAVRLARRVRALGYDGMVAAFETEAPAEPDWEAWVPRAGQRIAEAMGPRMTLIAVGGIDCMRRAIELRRSGASLVQIYRGFATAGPALVDDVGRAWGSRAAIRRAAVS